ncbi:MAG: alpha/beta hydrolase [Chloroflexota bacterium]
MKQKWMLVSLITLFIFLTALLIGCQQQNLKMAATTLLVVLQSSEREMKPPPLSTDARGNDGEQNLNTLEYMPVWEETRCLYRPERTESFECGYVMVPENRRLSSSEEQTFIRLYVTVIHSRNQNAQPDPVIYLSGGPGGRTFPFIRSISRRFDEILEERDLILFDQRGIHLSEPNLDCPEILDWKMATLDQSLARNEVVSGNIKANLSCLDRLNKSDIDVSAYTSAASALDIDDIRQALGYEQVNLYGVSYGSRLALTAMRDLEETGTIRSVILDSVYSPPEDLFIGLSPNAERVFSLLFQRCADDIGCNTAYPNLEITYYDLVAQLSTQPKLIEVAGRASDDGPFTMLLDGDDTIRLLFNMMYDTNTIPKLPQLITEMASGKYDNPDLQRWLRWLIISAEFFSEGMWYSVMCGEEAHFGNESLVRAGAGDAHPAIQAYFIDLAMTIDYATCDVWGAHPADAVENEVVVSSIPTLVLAGEFDPITPPAWSQRAANPLSHVYYLEFPDVGHGVLIARQCARDITADFVAQPNHQPNIDCMSDLPPLQFVLPE